MPIRFLHAADLHLDTPFSTRGRYPGHVAAVLRDASLGAFDRLVEAAIGNRVHFVVIAGDVYDGAERGVRAQFRFRDGLARLADRGIRTFVAHGNHDPVDEGWSAIDSFPPLVTVFPRDEVASVEFEVEGEPVTVHGVSYGRSRVTENLALRFERPTTSGLHVGVLHANVGSDPAHDPYSPCSIADLVAVGLDYWALGHVHTRRVLQREPWIVYPGNLQGRATRASESGAKGALLVEVDGGRIREPQLHAFDLVRFAAVEVDATDRDVDGLIHALIAAGDAARVAVDGRSLLLSATITGSSDLHERLRTTALATDLLEELRNAAGAGDPFLWWDGLAVATRAAADLRSLSVGDDFLADVLVTSEELAGGEDGTRESWAGGLTADIVRLAAEVDPLPELDDLWAEATELAVDLLAGRPT